MSVTPESFEILGRIETGKSVKRSAFPPAASEETSVSKRQRKPVQRVGFINTELAVRNLDGGVSDHDDNIDSGAESDEYNFHSSSTKKRSNCICGRTIGGASSIKCESCKSLFHGKCVRIDKSYKLAIYKAGDVWVCPNCVSTENDKNYNPQALTPLCVACKINPRLSNNLFCSAKKCQPSYRVKNKPCKINKVAEPVAALAKTFRHNEASILQRLSIPLPETLKWIDDHYLSKDPYFYPNLKTYLTIIDNAKRGRITVHRSSPSSKFIRGGYIYVFFRVVSQKGSMVPNFQATSFKDFSFKPLSLKRFPVSDSDVSIFEKLEAVDSSTFQRRAVWLSSDPKFIVVNYIGEKPCPINVDVVTIDDEEQDNKPVAFTDDVLKRFVSEETISPLLPKISLPSGITIVQESICQPRLTSVFSMADGSELNLFSDFTSEKSSVEVVEILSDEEENISKKRKKLPKKTPKRKHMPNLPPKQSEFYKVKQNLSSEENSSQSRTSKLALTINRMNGTEWVVSNGGPNDEYKKQGSD